MLTDLKKLGITFQDPQLVEKHYLGLKAIFINGMLKPDAQGIILDLNALPSAPFNFKEAVIKWLVYVNLPRITAGQEPMVTLTLVLQCPIWKVIKPPLLRISLTKEQLFGKPEILSHGKKKKAGAINKR